MNRQETYGRKIRYIVEKLSDVPPDLENDLVFDALLHRLHTSIEAAMDKIVMLVKDLGGEVGDDYTNIEFLREKNIISEEIEEKLKKLNGLRNIIVHRYNKIDKTLIVENLDDIVDSIFKFLDVVENVLREIYG